MDTNKDKAGNTATDKTSKTSAASVVSGKSLANSSAESASDNDNNAMKNIENGTSKKSAAAKKSSDMNDEGFESRKPSETEKGGPLYKFFTDSLKDMYFAEKHILEALPKMKDATTTAELQEAFEDHHLMTQKHVSRLEKVFRMIGEEPEAKKCEAIIGIVKEGETCIKDTDEGSMTRDAALIIAAQKVEHYEIASYGGLAALAETLELYNASDLLHTTMKEEQETDDDLTHIAESFINFAAKDDEGDGYDEGDYYDDEEDNEDNYEYERSNRSRNSYY